MKVTLHHTGYEPVDVEALAVFQVEEMMPGDKRGVRITAVQVGPLQWRFELAYLTSWGVEQNFYRRSGADTLHDGAQWVREHAPKLLPPGAGFPATPQYETRQRKLEGMMETLTLVALTELLTKIKETQQ
jgi:hypothetical protein